MTRFSVLALSVILLCGAAFSASVHAHARWAEGSEGGLTPARSSSSGLKIGPCGGIAREDDANRPATVLVSGSQVNLKIYQSIFHQGDYRVYFSEKNDEGLFEYDKTNAEITSTPTAENTLVSPGELIDKAGQTFYEVEVTLPNMECDDCVLQLIQHMPNNQNNPYYYSCADIILTVDGSNPTDPVDTSPPDPVSHFEVAGGDSHAILQWRNPSVDFAEVVLLQSDTVILDALQSGVSYNVGETTGDSKVVYRGRATSQRVDELVNGSKYHFSIFASDDNLNYSSVASVAVDLPVVSINTKPLVTLVAEQNTIVETEFKTEDGDVLIQANVEDGNSQDSHTFDWSATSEILIDTDAEDSTFTFDPSGVDAGEYLIVVSVQDDGTPPLSNLAYLNISIKQSFIDPVPPEQPEPEPTTEPTPQPTPEPTEQPEPQPTPTSDPTDLVNDSGEDEGGGLVHWQLLIMLIMLQLVLRSFTGKFDIVRCFIFRNLASA